MYGGMRERIMKSMLAEKSRRVPSTWLDRLGAGAVAQHEGGHAAVPPFKASRILVPTDFSSCSRTALEQAISLGRTFGAQITLLHVVPLNFTAGGFSLINYPFSKRRLLRQAERRLN